MASASNIKRCLKCHGPVATTPTITLHTTCSVVQFTCLSCGRLSPAGVKPLGERELTPAAAEFALPKSGQRHPQLLKIP